MAVTSKQQAKLIGPLARIARAFSRNWKIDVRFSGTKICTNGTTIFLPANADFLGDEQLHIMEGMLDHEMAHVGEETEAAESGGRVPSPLALISQSRMRSNREALFLNAFEDVRIERKWGSRYIGVGENLAVTREYLTKHVTAAGAKNPRADPWSLLACAMISEALGHDRSWAPAYVSDIMARLADIPVRARSLKHAGECQALAQETVKRVLELAEEMEKDSTESGDLGGEEGEAGGDGEGEEAAGGEAAGGSSGKGEAGGEGEEADAEGGAAGEGEGEGEEGDAGGSGSGSGEGDGADDAAGEGEGGKGAEKSKAGRSGKSKDQPKGKAKPDYDSSTEINGDGDPTPGGGVGGGKPTDRQEAAKPFDPSTRSMLDALAEHDAKLPDLGDLIRRMVEEASKKDITKNHRHIPHPLALAGDIVSTMRNGRPEEYNALLDRVRPTVAGLRSRILAALRSRKQSWLQGDREEGALDPDALHTVRLGNKRVFAEMTKGEGVEVAVGILIDQSGSMSSKVPMTRAAAIALAECLSKIGVPFAVWGFDNGGSVPSSKRDADDELYNRWEPFRFDVYKDFAEKFIHTKTRLANIHSGGNNCDGEAVEWAALKLAARPEPRKILLVLSDGAPACATRDHGALFQHLKDTVARVEHSGIECFGLGIQSSAVQEFYNDWTVVNNLSDLAPEMFRMLRKYLVQGKHSRPTAKLTAEFRR